MKFHAKIKSKEMFFKMLTAVEKLGRQCYLVFSEQHLQLFLVPNASNPLKARLEVSMEYLFSDTIIQSMSENNIYLEVDLPHLSQTIKGCIRANDVNISLTKKDNYPYLTVFVKPNADIRINHDIPVNILKKEEFERSVVVPLQGDADVEICLPTFKQFYSLVERYKVFSVPLLIDVYKILNQLNFQFQGPRCKFAASTGGRLSIQTASTEASVTTFFKDLFNPNVVNGSGDAEGEQNTETIGEQHQKKEQPNRNQQNTNFDEEEDDDRFLLQQNDRGNKIQKDKDHENIEDGQENIMESQDQLKTGEVFLEVKPFLKVLSSHQLSPSNVVACMIKSFKQYLQPSCTCITHDF